MDYNASKQKKKKMKISNLAGKEAKLTKSKTKKIFFFHVFLQFLIVC